MNENLVDDFQSNNRNEWVMEKEIENWNERNSNLEKIIIQIKFTKEHQVIYSKDGVLLKIQQLNSLRNPQTLNNMEQIQNLSWQGQYDQRKQRVGKWTAIWNNNPSMNVSGYYLNGQKQGIWRDIYKNYWSKAQIVETGEYYKDYKVGKWDYFNKNKKVNCGGFYNDEGKKIGKWIELDERFYFYAQITYVGEYNKKSKKINGWDICFNYGGNKQIGGGLYDQEGNQKKIGMWVELDEQFNKDKKITYHGEYNKKGMKVGRWDIWFDYKENEKIGGGSYDLEGSQKKIGNWIELDQQFRDVRQITHIGKYNRKGMKVGQWNIMYCGLNRDGVYKQIMWFSGGGSYDQEGCQKKIGIWVEIDESFSNWNQVIYNGEYNKKGIKIGQWDIFNMKYENSICGCINYDNNGNEIYKSKNEMIIFVGSFKNNMKVGRWDILYDRRGFGDYQHIKYNLCFSGGGQYGQDESQKKIGKWIELHELFKVNKFITYYGEYNKNGMKVGRWDIWFDCGQNKQIGGGYYDQEGGQKKIGKWIELDDLFSEYNQVAYYGEYDRKGKKKGKWVQVDIKKNKQKDEKLKGKKKGKWVQVDIKKNKQQDEKL